MVVGPCASGLLRVCTHDKGLLKAKACNGPARAIEMSETREVYKLIVGNVIASMQRIMEEPFHIGLLRLLVVVEGDIRVGIKAQRF